MAQASPVIERMPSPAAPPSPEKGTRTVPGGSVSRETRARLAVCRRRIVAWSAKVTIASQRQARPARKSVGHGGVSGSTPRPDRRERPDERRHPAQERPTDKDVESQDRNPLVVATHEGDHRRLEVEQNQDSRRDQEKIRIESGKLVGGMSWEAKPIGAARRAGVRYTDCLLDNENEPIAPTCVVERRRGKPSPVGDIGGRRPNRQSYAPSPRLEAPRRPCPGMDPVSVPARPRSPRRETRRPAVAERPHGSNPLRGVVEHGLLRSKMGASVLDRYRRRVAR